MAKGRKTGGRKKGTPNRITGEARTVLEALLEKRLPDLDAMIEDAWRGIEIEKQMPNGETVVGRFNADPARAAKLILEAYKLLYPPPQPIELSGSGGGPVVVEIRKYSEE